MAKINEVFTYMDIHLFRNGFVLYKPWYKYIWSIKKEAFNASF